MVPKLSDRTISKSLLTLHTSFHSLKTFLNSFLALFFYLSRWVVIAWSWCIDNTRAPQLAGNASDKNRLKWSQRREESKETQNRDANNFKEMLTNYSKMQIASYRCKVTTKQRLHRDVKRHDTIKRCKTTTKRHNMTWKWKICLFGSSKMKLCNNNWKIHIGWKTTTCIPVIHSTVRNRLKSFWKSKRPKRKQNLVWTQPSTDEDQCRFSSNIWSIMRTESTCKFTRWLTAEHSAQKI